MNELFDALTSLPTPYYWKQWCIAILFALLFVPGVMYFSNGASSLAMGLYVLAGFNTLLYPFAHAVQERLDQAMGGKGNTVINWGDGSTNSDDTFVAAILTIIFMFILKMVAIALFYLLQWVLWRFIFWTLAIPLFPVAAILIRKRLATTAPAAAK